MWFSISHVLNQGLHPWLTTFFLPLLITVDERVSLDYIRPWHTWICGFRPTNPIVDMRVSLDYIWDLDTLGYGFARLILWDLNTLWLEILQWPKNQLWRKLNLKCALTTLFVNMKTMKSASFYIEDSKLFFYEPCMMFILIQDQS